MRRFITQKDAIFRHFIPFFPSPLFISYLNLNFSFFVPRQPFVFSKIYIPVVSKSEIYHLELVQGLQLQLIYINYIPKINS